MMTTTTLHKIARQAITHGAQQKINELSAFLDLLDGYGPQVVVEIGVAEGGTLWAWQWVASTVIGVDAGDYTITAPTEATIITADSHLPSTLSVLTECLAGHPVDCLFLDGDHSYAGVKQDFDMYRPLVRSGGLVAFHDIASASTKDYQVGVPQFWEEIRGDDATEIIDSAPGSGSPWGDAWGGIGVLTL